jgi:hypothetical protein
MDRENSEDNSQLLTCWKDIAGYLGKCVRTVQRWEQELGLPVLRPGGVHYKSAVIARTRDLDAWMESQWTMRKVETKDDRQFPADMNDLIKTARELRSAHLTLVQETSSALRRLVENCNQLGEIRTVQAWKGDPEQFPSFQEALGDATSTQYES